MSDGRCPRCGGLLAPGADWCGQCFHRLGPGAPSGEPDTHFRPEHEEAPDPGASTGPGPAAREPAPTPTDPSRAAGPFEVEGEEVRWECPTCGSSNPIEAMACTRCGASFGQLMERGTGPSTEAVPASTAVRRSLLFPGLGHAAVGRRAEGLARGVLFAWVVGTLVALLLVRGGQGIGPYLALATLYVAAAVGLYAVTAVDAGRAARGTGPLVSSRVLLYGVSGLMLLTVVVLFVVWTRVAR